MIAIDLDGTLLDYDYDPYRAESRVNYALLRQLRIAGVEQAAIATIQGGTPFGLMGAKRRDGRCYPTPDDFMRRLHLACEALRNGGIAVAAVRVCVFHPHAEDRYIQAAARFMRQYMPGVLVPDWRVYTTAAARKPSPLMLRSVGASEYWGDSDEDEGAAQAAGIPFVRVARFY